jgi:WD40 repeat protein
MTLTRFTIQTLGAVVLLSFVQCRRDTSGGDVVADGVPAESVDADSVIQVKGPVSSLVLTPDGKTAVVTAGDDLVVLDLAAKAVGALRLTGATGAGELAISRDGIKLAATTSSVVPIAREGTKVTVEVWPGVQVWDLSKRRSLRNLGLRDGPAGAIAFSADGSHLYIGTGVVRELDIGSGQMRLVYSPDTDPQFRPDRVPRVDRLAVSPDGTTLAMAYHSETLLWDLGTASVTHRLATQESAPSEITFSPDGTLLGMASHAVLLWSTKTGQRTATLEDLQLRRRGTTPRALKFSPNGTLVAVAFGGLRGKPSYVLVWRVIDREHLLTFQCHDDAATQVAFLPTGDRILTGSRDCTIRIWSLAKLLSK